MTPRARARELATFAKRARRLSELTDKSRALRCTGLVACIKREQRRKLRGGLRPFGVFDLDRLCQGCRAHWHLTMASVELDAIEGAAAERARLVQLRGTRR